MPATLQGVPTKPQNLAPTSRPRTVPTWVTVLAVVVTIAVVAGVASAAIFYRRNHHFTSAQPVGAAAHILTLEDAMQANTAVPDVAAALADGLGNAALGQLIGQVNDAATGETLWQQGADTTLIPASNTKLLTAAAALLTLDPESTLTTTVSATSTPGQIVLTGAGDVTLAETADTRFYTDAATLTDLATQVRTALGGQQVTSIIVDNSAAPGERFNPTWDRDDIAGGNVTDVDSVMINGGRLRWAQSDSPRTTSPALDAGTALARELGVSESAVTVSQQAVPATTQLGEVHSAPLDIRIADMLTESDNILAEAIGREIARSRGQAADFDGSTATTLDVLSSAGFTTQGIVLKDNSGMSGDNRISPALLATILTAAAQPTATTPGATSGTTVAGVQVTPDMARTLRPLLDGLPIAGGTGTLASRYAAGTSSALAAGWARAKTGTLSGVNALSGMVVTHSGRVLMFSFISNGGTSADATRVALDTLVAGLRAA